MAEKKEPKYTVDEIKGALATARTQKNRIAVFYLNAELKRRKSSGRPSSGKTARERNRDNSKAFRDRKKQEAQEQAA
jgi:hypothetical protein